MGEEKIKTDQDSKKDELVDQELDHVAGGMEANNKFTATEQKQKFNG